MLALAAADALPACRPRPPTTHLQRQQQKDASKEKSKIATQLGKVRQQGWIVRWLAARFASGGTCCSVAVHHATLHGDPQSDLCRSCGVPC